MFGLAVNGGGGYLEEGGRAASVTRSCNHALKRIGGLYNKGTYPVGISAEKLQGGNHRLHLSSTVLEKTCNTISAGNIFLFVGGGGGGRGRSVGGGIKRGVGGGGGGGGCLTSVLLIIRWEKPI